VQECAFEIGQGLTGIASFLQETGFKVGKAEGTLRLVPKLLEWKGHFFKERNCIRSYWNKQGTFL
jgi:hypothetical protein